ncbi:helicase [Caulobacter sp. 602-2]|uniref:Helicase n=1 Tax=Caulobacter sp. 602-2 TaxID=2710887 RepID=A0A6G4QUM2_9CAUL|nr:helicase [Caulobacter sp. 602-2]NGM49232.1 helicase [Caulobacter sp. 602-2]
MPKNKVDRSQVSRRAVIGAAATAPALPVGAVDFLPGGDPALVRFGTFVALDLRICRLVNRWADLESDVFQNHNWLNLTEEQQLALPQGQEMARIDAMLPDLFRQRHELTEALPKVAAANPTEIAAKVAAAARLVDPEDNEPAHLLLTGAVRDLAAMRCPDCNRPLVLEGWIEWSVRAGRDGSA